MAAGNYGGVLRTVGSTGHAIFLVFFFFFFQKSFFIGYKNGICEAIGDRSCCGERLGQAPPKDVHSRENQGHFQNADTFDRWFKRFVPIAVERRGDHTTPITLILDAADQHNTSDECKALAALHNIKFVGVPPKMTHVFQPADQFVICNLKKYVVNSWNDFVQALFRELSLDDAVKTMHSTALDRIRRNYAREETWLFLWPP